MRGSVWTFVCSEVWGSQAFSPSAVAHHGSAVGQRQGEGRGWSVDMGSLSLSGGPRCLLQTNASYRAGALLLKCSLPFCGLVSNGVQPSHLPHARYKLRKSDSAPRRAPPCRPMCYLPAVHYTLGMLESYKPTLTMITRQSFYDYPVFYSFWRCRNAQSSWETQHPRTSIK